MTLVVATLILTACSQLIASEKPSDSPPPPADRLTQTLSTAAQRAEGAVQRLAASVQPPGPTPEEIAAQAAEAERQRQLQAAAAQAAAAEAEARIALDAARQRSDLAERQAAEARRAADAAQAEIQAIEARRTAAAQGRPPAVIAPGLPYPPPAPPPPALPAPGLPPDLTRPLTAVWVGPAAILVQRIAEVAGWRFVTTGHPPKVPPLVDISASGRPLWELLKDVGVQIGGRGTVVIDAQTRTIELRYDV